MYNALVLISLLPLTGPEAGQHVAAMPRAETMLVAQTDPGNEVPTLPVRVAYTPDATSPPVGPPVRQPITPVVGPPVKPAPPDPLDQPTIAATTSQPAALAPVAEDPAGIRTWGVLDIPKRNNVVLAARHQSALMNLKTEQRDAEGNIITGADGRPIMVPLREGMTVFKDQVLGNFDDRELVHAVAKAEAQLEVAISERDKTIEIEHAAIAAEVAKAEAAMLQATNQLHEGAISRLEILKAGLSWEQAKAQHKLQEYTINQVRTKEVVVYEREVEAAKVRIDERKLIAPIGGMIVRIDKAEGEWLREGDEVLEIMQLETLRAKCKINARYTPAMVDGKNVTIYVTGSDEQFQGRVVFAHPKIHYSSKGDGIGEIDAYIEVRNRPNGKYWRLQPGHEITAVIHL